MKTTIIPSSVLSSGPVSTITLPPAPGPIPGAGDLSTQVNLKTGSK